MDRFLRTEIEARALDFALARGWIDAIGRGGAERGGLAQAAGVTPQGTALLFDLLTAAGVIAAGGGPLAFTPAFAEALRYRDLLEAKLWFAKLVAPDVHGLFEALVTDIPQFMGRARVFELFRYDLATAITPANLEATGRWVGYTTALTRYEAGPGLERLPLEGRRHMLDVGGNSGEFVRQAVARTAGLGGEVFDLPVVCELGRRHLAGTAEAGRVRFTPGDLRRDSLPGGADIISFKSMLHDWPDDFARGFLAKAVAALAPGGLLVIYERGEIAAGTSPLPFSMVANLVFMPFFRAAPVYRGWLTELGLAAIETQDIVLEMPFHLITARKPA